MTGNQKKIGIWLLMLVMAAVFFSGTVTVKAEDETVQTEEKEKFPAPQNVSISDNWILSFDSVPDAKGYYRIEIMKDGTQCGLYKTVSLDYIDEDGIFRRSIVEYLKESGSYSVKVQTLSDYDPDKYEDSDYSELVVKDYVKPDTQLESTVAVWDEQNPGHLLVSPVESADKYEFRLFQVDLDGELLLCSSLSHPGDSALTEFSVDISFMIEKLGAGKYVVKVRALSSNPDEIANGEWGEASAVYDTEEQAVTTDKIISDAVRDEDTVSNALNTVVNQVSKDKLGMDMQTNDKVLGQMKELEEKYVNEKRISTEKLISEEAAKYISPESVSIIGAGLNVETGTVSLDISIPEEEVKVSGEVYAKSMQFDIKLKNGNNEIQNLKVPVTITMPVPENLDTKHLILLHYHGTGGPERVIFKDNNDGTVTFTVKDFSVFVFAESAEDADEGNKQPEESGKEPENETEASEEEWEDEEEETESETRNAGETNSAFRAPQTSDASHAGLYFGIFAVSLLTLLGLKRNTFIR